nr:zinc finger RNA-binding protein-like isoform X1 [Ipomoea batatas]
MIFAKIFSNNLLDSFTEEEQQKPKRSQMPVYDWKRKTRCPISISYRIIRSHSRLYKSKLPRIHTNPIKVAAYDYSNAYYQQHHHKPPTSTLPPAAPFPPQPQSDPAAAVAQYQYLYYHPPPPQPQRVEYGGVYESGAAIHTGTSAAHYRFQLSYAGDILLVSVVFVRVNITIASVSESLTGKAYQYSIILDAWACCICGALRDIFTTSVIHLVSSRTMGALLYCDVVSLDYWLPSMSLSLSNAHKSSSSIASSIRPPNSLQHRAENILIDLPSPTIGPIPATPMNWKLHGKKLFSQDSKPTCRNFNPGRHDYEEKHEILLAIHLLLMFS